MAEIEAGHRRLACRFSAAVGSSRNSTVPRYCGRAAVGIPGVAGRAVGVDG